MKKMTRRIEMVILDLIGWGLAAGGVMLIMSAIQHYTNTMYLYF
jgi:hypothetical protein